MKSAPGRAGIGTSPWPCSPMQLSSSFRLRPHRSGERGPCRPRGETEGGRTAPPAACSAGLGGATGAATVVVALSPTASGQRPARPCRPPRPASSTNSTAGAASPARAEPAGTDASPLGPDLSAPAAVPVGPSGERSPADGGRHSVGHADGRFLAGVAGPLWPLANGGRVLPSLASRGSLGTDPTDLVGS